MYSPFWIEHYIFCFSVFILVCQFEYVCTSWLFLSCWSFRIEMIPVSRHPCWSSHHPTCPPAFCFSYVLHYTTAVRQPYPKYRNHITIKNGKSEIPRHKKCARLQNMLIFESLCCWCLGIVNACDYMFYKLGRWVYLHKIWVWVSTSIANIKV